MQIYLGLRRAPGRGFLLKKQYGMTWINFVKAGLDLEPFFHDGNEQIN